MPTEQEQHLIQAGKHLFSAQQACDAAMEELKSIHVIVTDTDAYKMIQKLKTDAMNTGSAVSKLNVRSKLA